MKNQIVEYTRLEIETPMVSFTSKEAAIAVGFTEPTYCHMQLRIRPGRVEMTCVGTCPTQEEHCELEATPTLAECHCQKEGQSTQPAGCHASVRIVTDPQGHKGAEIVCSGTCDPGMVCRLVAVPDIAPNAPPGGTYMYCNCVVQVRRVPQPKSGGKDDSRFV